MNTVVVGFDGSDRSRDALALGASLAQMFSADLVVAVIDEIHPFAWEYPKQGERTAYLQETLEQASQQLGSQGFTGQTLSGSVPECLEVVAANVAADILVVGSAHAGELGKVVSGSVGDRLMAGAPCAVAVAPRGCADGTAQRLERIGVGYDGEEESKQALVVANEIALAAGGSLRLIAVAPVLQVPAPGRISHTAPGYAEFVREYLAAKLGEAAAASSPRLEVAEALIEGDAAAVLRDQSRELDLLVLGSRGYGPIRRVFLGGVATKIVRDSFCPVVITPRSALPGRHQRGEALASTVF